MSETTRKSWTSLSVKTVYDNPWITVREHQAVAPTGNQTLYGVVHMKNFALGVLPIDADGCTYMVGQERFVFDAYSWELPEGGGARDVEPVEGAKRELLEETGLTARNWLPLLSNLHFSNSVTDEAAYAFIAWDLEKGVAEAHDPTEDMTVRRVPFKEALRMAVAGELTDAFSVVMLLKADHLLRAGALPPELMRLMQGRA